MEEEKALQAASNNIVAAENPIQSLVEKALDKQVDVETLERIIALAEKTQATIDQKEFEYHFGLMQQEFEPVHKTRSVKTKSGDHAYSYVNLDDILAVYKPILSRHGFSYRWEEETVTPDLKRITCVIAGYGHEKRSSVEVPIPPASSMTNSIQQRGSATSYGKRYSFCSAVGVIIQDEDDDAAGLTFADGVRYSVFVDAMNKAEDLEKLKSAWASCYKELSKARDNDGLEKMSGIYTSRKERLTNGSEN